MKKLTVFTILFILSSGCASIYTQISDPYSEALHDCAECRTIPNVYSGVVLDLQCLPAENAGFFCLLDLPLSAVVDTALLPYTVSRQIRHGHWFSRADCEKLRKEAQPD